MAYNALTFRDIKGAPLTHDEVDGNFRHLTGSHEISGSIQVHGDISASGNITASNILLTGDMSSLAGSDVSMSSWISASSLWVAGNSYIGGNLTLGGNLDATGNIDADGNVTTGDANTDSITFNADVTSNIRPNTDDTYDIGTTALRWKDIHAVTAQGEVSVQNHITASGTATLADEQYGIWMGPFSISGTVDIGEDSNFVISGFNNLKDVALINYTDY